jgi:hypothetical protein
LGGAAVRAMHTTFQGHSSCFFFSSIRFVFAFHKNPT